MTQEEARKFLMNKKVFVKNKSKEIQLKLFEIGFGWLSSSSKELKNLDCPFLYLYKDMTLGSGYSVNTFYEHNYEEISAEDILNIKVEHFPRTWEEFCANNPTSPNEAIIRFPYGARCTLPNAVAAMSHLTLMQLHQLRDCYRGNTDSTCCYSIIRGVFDLAVVYDNTRFLSFPTKKMAEEFLANFKDLIKEAEDLI